MGMSRRSRQRRKRAGLERLEPRLALSSPADVTDWDGATETLGLVGVDPPDGTVTTVAPRVLSVEFDREIDGFSLGLNDLRLDRLDESDQVVWSTEMAGLFLESVLDAAGTRVSVELPDDLVLEPGTYRLVISGWSLLGGIDGTPAVEFGTDRVVSAFSLSPRGATLDDAEDLGPLPPGTIVDVHGALDFEADPRAVRLYRFEVPASHGTWRLGAAVIAQADGSPLDAALSLFDATGRVLGATDKGLRDAPEDPFLYAGLAPGTYYLGVSGVGNLAGRPGSYDPASGLPELVSVTRASGPFRLSLVIDPADEPTRLVGLKVLRADRFDPTPTGLELSFSSLVYPKPREDDNPLVGIRLVGPDGRGWPLSGAEFDLERATLRYAIADRLPPGRYLIVLGNRYPLIDLAGRRPVAPGQPEGVLGSFEVTGRRPPHDAADLGVAFLRDLNQGLARSIDLQPGESHSYRLVLTRRDLLRLQLTYSGGTGRIEVVRGEGDPVTFELESVSAPRQTTRLLDLLGGEVTVRVSATGNQPFSLRWNLTTVAADHERLLLNGNGQGPALSLRLIAPGELEGPAAPPSEPGRISDRPAFDPVPEVSELGGSTIGAISVPVMVTPLVLPGGSGRGGSSVVLNPPTANLPLPQDGPGGSDMRVAIAPLAGLLLLPATEPVGRPVARSEMDLPSAGSETAAETAELAATAPTDAPFGQPGQDGTDALASTDLLPPPVGLPDLAAVSPDLANHLDSAEAPVEIAEVLAPALAIGSEQPLTGEPTVAGLSLPAVVPPVPEPPAAAPLVAASLDPLSWLPGRPNLDSESHSLKSDLSSPLGAVLVAAAVVDAQRRLRRWLGRRRGLRRAGPIEPGWRWQPF
ncbi:MAG: hypothetical protein KatS3mg108_0080 [Isosphaeraceae bacterium]|nr:MAG: hypothetical protein KatS3mg108_0080 [Isosphaeraceae bacterium]